MARPERNNVDYFPHPVKHGKKMFFIRSLYKNDGYTVWFILLEKIGDAEYHYLDMNDPIELKYLSAECMVDEIRLKNIINTLVELKEFDKELWEEYSILYNQKFVKTISDAYNKRSNKIITLESLWIHLHSLGRIKQSKSTRKPIKCQSEVPVNPQRIEENRIEEENIEKIYVSYPNKCLIQNRSTGKCSKDKKKIQSLLKSKTVNELIDIIEWYKSDCLNTKTYMKNFSTFLNNLPDKNNLTEKPKPKLAM